MNAPFSPAKETNAAMSISGKVILYTGAAGGLGNPQYGRPLYLGVALYVLIAILLISKYAKGFLRNVSVLLGLVIGMLVAMTLGEVNFGRLADAPWFALVYPFSFGFPIFDLPPAICDLGTTRQMRPCSLSRFGSRKLAW